MSPSDVLIPITLLLAILTPFISVAVSWGMSKEKNQAFNQRIDRLETDLREVQRLHVTSDELNEVKSDIKEMRKEQTVMFEKLLSILSTRFNDHRTP